MPTLPGGDSLSRSIPQSSGGVVSYDGGQVGRAMLHAGAEINAAGEQVYSTQNAQKKQEAEKQGRLEYAFAKSDFLRSQIETQQALSEDPDYTTYGTRYSEKMVEARTRAGGMISNPDFRQAFEADTADDIIRGGAAVSELAKKKETDVGIASGSETIDQNRQAYLNSPDENTRNQVMGATHQTILGMRDRGYISVVQSQDLMRKTALDYTTARWDMLPDEEKLTLGKQRVATGTFGGNPRDTPGMLEAGNIDLTNRPKVPNLDGGYSTVLSMSSEDNGKEVLIPRVVGGKILSEKDAWAHYKKTGENLGKFKTPEEATAYAEKLHEDQAAMYGGFDTAIKTVMDNEGGYVAVDGATKAPAIYGINRKWHEAAYDEAKRIKDSKGEEAGKAYAQEFYKKEYYDKYKIKELPAESQTVVLDGVINHSTAFAKKLVAAAKDGASADDLIEMRRTEYKRLATKDPASYENNLPGWESRIDGMKAATAEPAAGPAELKATGTWVDMIPADYLQKSLNQAKNSQGVVVREKVAEMEGAAKLGLKVPRENIEALATEAREYGMGPMSDKLLQYADLQDNATTFAVQGVKHQGKTLQLLKADVEGGDISKAPLYETYANIYKTKLDALKKDPWTYYAAHEVVREPEPMNLMDAGDVAAKIQRRRADMANVDQIEGGAYKLPVLTSGETDQIKNMYENGTPQQSAAVISSIGQALNVDERRALAQSIAPKSPMMATALSLKPDIALNLLAGAKTKGDVAEAKVRALANEYLGGAVFDPEAAESMHEAVFAYYKKLALDKGDVSKDPDSDRVKESIRAIAGDPITISPAGMFSGEPSKVFSYRGDDGEFVSEGDLEDILGGITDDILRKTNGALPYASDGDYIEAEQLLQNATFRSAGDGQYIAVYPGLGLVTGRDGKPYVLDARKIASLQ